MYKELEQIYKTLQDEESKMIFRQRLLFGLTGDLNYMKDMLLYYRRENKGYTDILDVLANPEPFRGKEIILFGTGVWSRPVKIWLDLCGLEISFLCDNNPQKHGKERYGKKILSPNQLFEEHKDAVVFIASEVYEKEILAQLLGNQFADERIIRIGFEHEELYMDNSIVKPQKEEIFIDGGCFDADTSLQFIDWAGGKVKKIYAFEPDPINYKMCEESFNEKCKVEWQLEPAGLWSEKTVLSFKDSGSASSAFNAEGTIKVPTASIDEVVGDDKVTFIKMDVEGAELEALKGAANTIKKNKPRLAICVYHKPEDIVDIPKYIKELVPEYKLYLRHYYPFVYDTVLYAVLDE